MTPDTTLTPAQALAALVHALDNAFISSWQSTAAWQTQLDDARAVLEGLRMSADGGKDIPL